MKSDFDLCRDRIRTCLEATSADLNVNVLTCPGLSNTEEYRLGAVRYEIADILGKMNREEDKAKYRYELEVRRLEETKEKEDLRKDSG